MYFSHMLIGCKTHNIPDMSVLYTYVCNAALTQLRISGIFYLQTVQGCQYGRYISTYELFLYAGGRKGVKQK
jgi:hypothetical protein